MLLSSRRRLSFLLIALFISWFSTAAASGDPGVRSFSAGVLLDTRAAVTNNAGDAFGKTIICTGRDRLFSAFKQSGAARVTGFPLPGGATVDLEVEAFPVFSPNARFISAGPAGAHSVPRPDLSCFRGRVPNDPSSFVFLAVDAAHLWGTVRTGAAEYSIFPQSLGAGTVSRPPIQISEVLRGRQESVCGVTESDELALPSPLPASFAKGIGARILRDTLLAEVAIDADYEAYQHYGGVTQAQTYISARFAEVSAIYERDMAIRMEISYIRVWSDVNDPYNAGDMSGALAEFTNYWKANMDTVKRDLAVFASQRSLSGYDAGVTAGLAALDALCNKSRGYAFDRLSGNDGFISGNTGVMAHEIGHVYGARHTHSCWWNPPVDSCVGPEDGNCYTNNNPINGEIMSYCGTKTNEFRSRVAPYVRQRAEAAPCLSITSRIRSIAFTAPAGGEAWCAGSSQNIAWSSTGVTYVKIELSSDGGGTFPTVLVASTSSIPKSWTWDIPANQPTGTQYRLRISDADVGTPIATMTANFQIKPVTAISQHPTGKTLCVGDNSQLIVAASGAPPVTYQWRRNGADIPGATASTLPLQNVAKQDSGTYVCVVTGACGSLTSGSALVQVRKGAQITRQPQSVTACIGRPAVIALEATGDGLTYRWYLGTNEITGATTNRLSFASVQQSDQGAYFCQVSSSCGGAMSSIAYLAIGTPGVAVTKPAGGEQYVVGDSLEILWTATCVDTVRIEYSSDGGAAWSTVVAPRCDAAQQRFIWRLPATPAAQGMIRITDVANGSLTARSNPFVVKSSTAVPPDAAARGFGLAQNFPNPFSEQTTIGLQLPDGFAERFPVRLTVYDLLGRAVLDLSAEARGGGPVTLRRSRLPGPGTYIYRLTAAHASAARMMTALE